MQENTKEVQVLSKDLINIDKFVSNIDDPSLNEASRMLALAYRKFQESTKTNLTFQEAGMNCDMASQLSKNAVANLSFRHMSKGRILGKIGRK